MTIVKQSLCILMLIALWVVSSATLAAERGKPLSADKAFAFTTTIDSTRTMSVKWQIAPGYYLYRQRIHFAFTPNLKAQIHFPQGKIQQDRGHDPYEVYAGDISIPIVFQTEVQKVQLKVDYQGCSERGFCYPPAHQTVMLDFTNKLLPQNNQVKPPPQFQGSLQTLLTDQNGVRDLLNSQRLSVMLLLFAGLGFLLAFTPCVLPMIPILTSIIVGHKQPVSTGRAFLLSSTYVLGSSITYALAGMMAASMGSSLQAWLQQPWIIGMVSGLFILLSFSLFGMYELRLPRYWQNRITAISHKQQGGTYLGVFVMGAVSTLIVSPCVTAPLVGVLMYIAESGNIMLGAGALFAMGIGMGLPLIVIGVSTGKWLPKRGPWMKLIQYLFGIMMLGMALWLLSRVFATIALLKWGAMLLIGVALFFGFYQSQLEEPRVQNRRIAWKTGLTGVFLMVLINTPFVRNSISSHDIASRSFKIVHNVADLDQQLLIAQASHKPVMLDFYADWCESCIVMDKKVFSLPDVINSLNHFVLLRADLSKNNTADELLLKQYDVVAPPAVLFFNNHGREVNSHRIVGELNPQEFMTRINTFITASCDTKVTC